MKITIDTSRKSGKSLVQKFDFFNSGMVPVDRYERDAVLFDRVRPKSLRFDVYMGDRSMEFGDLVDGTLDCIVYRFEKFDRLIRILQKHGIAPYVSWCYIPIPLQPEGGDFRSFPVDLDAYYKVIRTLSSHLKELMGDLPYYEEIYNEADCFDVFFTGTYDQFLELYERGIQAVKDAGGFARVGGPAEAYVLPPDRVQENLLRFLKFVEEKNLPLDFFSFHSYGHENGEYLRRCEEAEKILKNFPTFVRTELHLNEVNVVPAPWEFGKTILETEQMLPLIFNMVEELLEKESVSLVHWAQLLASGVDALGVIDEQGGLLPSFFAFEIYKRMPLPRLEPQSCEEIGCLSSMDEERFAAVLWNKGQESTSVELHTLSFPTDFGKAKCFVLDSTFFGKLKTFPHLALEEAMQDVLSLDVPQEFQLSRDTIIYLEASRIER